MLHTRKIIVNFVPVGRRGILNNAVLLKLYSVLIETVLIMCGKLEWIVVNMSVSMMMDLSKNQRKNLQREVSINQHVRHCSENTSIAINGLAARHHWHVCMYVYVCPYVYLCPYVYVCPYV